MEDGLQSHAPGQEGGDKEVCACCGDPNDPEDVRNEHPSYKIKCCVCPVSLRTLAIGAVAVETAVLHVGLALLYWGVDYGILPTFTGVSGLTFAIIILGKCRCCPAPTELLVYFIFMCITAALALMDAVVIATEEYGVEYVIEAVFYTLFRAYIAYQAMRTRRAIIARTRNGADITQATKSPPPTQPPPVEVVVVDS
eukprot:CAMPEP_0118927006 /NCGR_PEP_ID=MMETSP1169-20130426/4582_1 /TAXON_ID=36882 /ORGANISM="Pyramimonas obovata, Strain CCMP722" /LENGTH=196 /DNA_ID=CAMNT_0006868681 /DNA_START=203 /DNA_END=793 /DNA_ORIENTATION=+